jgi:hypothetical protein
MCRYLLADNLENGWYFYGFTLHVKDLLRFYQTIMVGNASKNKKILTSWAPLWIMIDELLGIIYYLWGGGQRIYTVGNFPSVHFGSAF